MWIIRIEILSVNNLDYKWAELDSNQRSETQRIYNPLPLTTRAPTRTF